MIQDISLKNGHLIYKGIVYAVNIHRQATKFVYSPEHFKSLCIILYKHYSKHEIICDYICEIKYRLYKRFHYLTTAFYRYYMYSIVTICIQNIIN